MIQIVTRVQVNALVLVCLAFLLNACSSSISSEYIEGNENRYQLTLTFVQWINYQDSKEWKIEEAKCFDEYCDADIDSATFRAFQELLRNGRLGDQTRERNIRRFIEVRIISSDGKYLIFGGRNEARDTDGTIYELNEAQHSAVMDLAYRSVQYLTGAPIR